jgi:hypothetical protein
LQLHFSVLAPTSGGTRQTAVDGILITTMCNKPKQQLGAPSEINKTEKARVKALSVLKD